MEVLVGILWLVTVGQVVVGLDNGEDYYTSVVGIQRLARQEQAILKSMVDYVEKLETRKNLIMKYIKDYEESVSPVLKGFPFKDRIRKFTSKISIYDKQEDLNVVTEAISAHPFLAHRLLRRFAREMPEVMIDFSTEIEKDFVRTMSSFVDEFRIPNTEDVDGSADGLLRIQVYYNFDLDEFIHGKFHEVETNTGLTAFDLHYVGIRATTAKKLFRAVEWLERSLDQVRQGDKSIPEDLVRKHLEEVLVQHNDALEATKNDENRKDINIFPSSLYKPLAVNSSLLDLAPMKKTLQKQWKESKNSLYYTDDRLDDSINFKALCSGKPLKKPASTRRLKCYLKRNTGRTVIAPFKMEVHSISPPIVQIYNVMSDKTIAEATLMASPFLLRARILGTPDNPNQKSSLRTSAVTWLRESLNRNLRDIPRIIHEVTGLNATSGSPAEDLQVSSYGSIGGHYEYHSDALFDAAHIPYLGESDKFRGDRIATVMFYMTDVIKGGSTVFPRLGVAANPVKGSAVFWYNLMKNGDKNTLMLHGACPVVFGNKWVANKWIRRNDHMFMKPCGKSEQAHWSIHDEHF